MKKILQILYSGLGGIGSVCFSIVNASKNDNSLPSKHSAIFYGIEPLVEDYKKKCSKLDIDYTYFIKKKGLDISTQISIAKQIKTIQPDVIILHSPQTIFACMLSKLIGEKYQLILVEHQANHLKTQKDWSLSRLGLYWANKVAYLTDNYKNEVQEKLKNTFKESKTSVIPNGIDLNIFKPKVKTAVASGINIGMASRIAPNKDHLTLLEAIALLKTKLYFYNIHLLIAGDGTELENLKIESKKLNISDKVTFMGMLNENELADFLTRLDIYIHASFGETMSTSIMQAQATGLPIIASNVKGINNVINTDKNGLLFEAKNANDLAGKIDLLMNDSKLRDTFAEQSLIYAQQKLSNQQMWNSYKALF